jgi:CBS domain-containing protein
MANIRCEDLMTRDPRTVKPGDTLLDAIRVYKELNVGFIPVCEDPDGRLVGVLTDRDVALALSKDQKPSQIRVAQCMSRDPVTCRPGDDAFSAAQKMEEHQIRRIPVVDDDNILMGVIATADIARASEDRKELETEVPTIMQSISEPG